VGSATAIGLRGAGRGKGRVSRRQEFSRPLRWRVQRWSQLFRQVPGSKPQTSVTQAIDVPAKTRPTHLPLGDGHCVDYAANSTGGLRPRETVQQGALQIADRDPAPATHDLCETEELLPRNVNLSEPGLPELPSQGTRGRREVVNTAGLAQKPVQLRDGSVGEIVRLGEERPEPEPVV